MKNQTQNEKPSHRSRGSVLDDLGFNPSEALEIKLKAAIYTGLLDYIHLRAYSQQQLGILLGMHQPDVSNLLNGKISKFSIGKLIKLAGKLDLDAHIELVRPNMTKAAKTRARISTAA